jgi:lipopolysaccharide biosynthesis glycosyltransferase
MKTALVLACDDRFIPFTAVVARRIVHHAAEKFPVIVISDDVSDENKALAQKFCPEISFIEAAPLFEHRPLPARGTFSRAAYLRLFLDDILADFGRAVYLDSDISLLTDVSPLLALKPKAAPIIAAYDMQLMIEDKYRDRLHISAPYFNSGVMVLDLRAIRAERIFDNALRYALDHPERCEFVDQDALNAVLNGRWQVLDWRWNSVTWIRDMVPREPFIRHFARYKPWARKKAGIEQRFVDEWRSDLAESPWPDRFSEQSIKYPIKDAIKRIGSAVHAMFAGRRDDGDERRRVFAKALSGIEQAAAAGEIAGFPAFNTPPRLASPGTDRVSGPARITEDND